MPSDDYAAAGGGALRFKGAKVQKKKKKKREKKQDKSDLEKNLSTGDGTDDKGATSPHDDDDDDGEPAVVPKTESERRHEEIRKKRLLQTAQTSSIRPELLKTHKERVEELNTYLSKLSEHHDMPKIGPG